MNEKILFLLSSPESAHWNALPAGEKILHGLFLCPLKWNLILWGNRIYWFIEAQKNQVSADRGKKKISG